MNKPYKYTIICKKTGRIEETNIEPLLHHLQTWEETEDKNKKVLMQTKECYIDTRYEAKLRLYNYLTYTRHGLHIPRYAPYKSGEVGKSIPILNF